MTVDRFDSGDDLWMLATGTGVGPFVSILRDPLVWQKFNRLILVHCVRHASEFAYHEQMALFQKNPPSGASAQLQLLQTTTREPSTNGTRLTGRITTLLESGELERAAGVPINDASSRIMLCGNPDMIEETRRLLHLRGLRPVRRTLPGHFVTENYW